MQIYNLTAVAKVPTAVHWLTVNKYRTYNQEQKLLTAQQFGGEEGFSEKKKSCFLSSINEQLAKVARDCILAIFIPRLKTMVRRNIRHTTNSPAAVANIKRTGSGS